MSLRGQIREQRWAIAEVTYVFLKNNLIITGKLFFVAENENWNFEVSDHTSTNRCSLTFYFWRLGSSANVFNADFLLKLLVTVAAAFLQQLSSYRWMFTQPQTHTTKLWARLIDVTESGFISFGTFIWAFWAPTDSTICPEAYSPATFCIKMFYSLSNHLTIWNIPPKCKWDVLTTSNFLQNAQLFGTFADALSFVLL